MPEKKIPTLQERTRDNAQDMSSYMPAPPEATPTSGNAPKPEVSSIGANPKQPLPQIPEAHIDPGYARARSDYFTILMERERGNDPFHRSVDSAPQYQTLVKKAQAYQTEQFEFTDVNNAFTSFIAAGDLAADMLADHIHLQDTLGLSDLKNLTKGLSQDQKDQVGDDMADVAAAISQAKGDLDNDVRQVAATQKTFLGAGHQLSSFLTGQVVASLQGKIKEAEDQEAEIKTKIREFGELGNKIQAGIMIAVSAFSLGGALETASYGAGAEAEEAAKEVTKGATEIKDSAQEIAGKSKNGLIGSLLEKLASAHYAEQLQALKNVVIAAQTQLGAAKMQAEAQQFQGLKEAFEGTLESLKAQIEKTARDALKLREAMTPKPKPKHHKDKAKPAGPTPKGKAAAANAQAETDPVQRVEQFLCSAIATSSVLSGGVAAGKLVNDQLTPVMSRTTAARGVSYIYREVPGSYGGPNQEHEDTGQGAPDSQMLYAMANFVTVWVREGEKQKTVVADEVAQGEALKA